MRYNRAIYPVSDYKSFMDNIIKYNKDIVFTLYSVDSYTFNFNGNNIELRNEVNFNSWERRVFYICLR